MKQTTVDCTDLEGSLWLSSSDSELQEPPSNRSFSQSEQLNLPQRFGRDPWQSRLLSDMCFISLATAEALYFSLADTSHIYRGTLRESRHVWFGEICHELRGSLRAFFAFFYCISEAFVRCSLTPPSSSITFIAIAFS